MTAYLTNTPVLETDRLILRAPAPEDFEVFAPFAMSDRAVFVGGGADKGVGHAWRMLAIITGHWHLRGFGTFVAELKETGKPIGSMGAWYPGDWPEHELGWTVWTADAEGTGLAYEAVTETRRHAYADLGWSTAVSYIDVNNARSEALAKRLGCTLDPEAPLPRPEDPVRAWRHPTPAEVAA